MDWEAAVALGPRPGCAWLSGRGLAPEGLLYSPAVWAISDFPIIKFKKFFFGQENFCSDKTSLGSPLHKPVRIKFQWFWWCQTQEAQRTQLEVLPTPSPPTSRLVKL